MHSDASHFTMKIYSAKTNLRVFQSYLVLETILTPKIIQAIKSCNQLFLLHIQLS